MSYDLAVWVGEEPATDREAAKEHDRLYEEYLEGDGVVPLEMEISNFLAVLTDRWPDRSAGDDSPWASIPLDASASGSYVYLTLAWARAEEMSVYVTEVAHRFGLNCFDPQLGSLRRSES